MFILAASLTFNASNLGLRGTNSLSNLIIIANAEEENPADEKDRAVAEWCVDKYCDCVACIKGTTDCTPTCPCCDE